MISNFAFRFSLLALLTCYSSAFFSQTPQLVLQTRHERSIEQIAISDNGQYMATASAEGKLFLWEGASGFQFQRLLPSQSDLIELAFLPKQTELVLAYEDKILGIQLPKSEISPWNIDFPGTLTAMSISPDGQYLALACDLPSETTSTRDIRVWDRKQQKWAAKHRQQDEYVNTLTELAFSPDGEQLYATGDGTGVWAWKWQTNRQAKPLVTTQLYSQDGLAINTTGRWLAAQMGSVGGFYVGIWDLQEDRLAHRIAIPYRWNLEKLVFDQTTHVLIAGYSKGVYDASGMFQTGATQGLVIAYDIDKESEVWRHEQTGGILDIGWNSVFSSIMVVDIERGIKSFSANTGLLLDDYGEDRIALHAITWDQNQQVLWIGGERGILNGWDPTQGIIKKRKETGFRTPVHAVAFDSLSGYWAAASYRSARIWNHYDQLIDSFQIKEGQIHQMIFTRDKQQLMVVGTNFFGVLANGLKVLEGLNQGKRPEDLQDLYTTPASVSLRDIERRRSTAFPPGVTYPGLGTEIQRHPLFDDVFLAGERGQYMFPIGKNGFQGPLDNHENMVLSSAFSPRGKYLATAGEDEYVVLTELLGDNTVKINGYSAPIRAIAFSEDETWMATGAGSSLSVYSLSPLEQKTEIELEGEISYLVFTSQYLLVAGPEIGISCWDYLRGEKLATFVPSGDRNALTYTPDGFYRANKEGIRTVAFRAKGKMYSFDQFDLLQNRPDKVLESLLGEDKNTSLINLYRQAYLKRLRRYGLLPERQSNDYKVPSCGILNLDQVPLSTPSSILSLDILATDSLHSLDRLNVFVNNVPIYGIAGINLREQNTQEYSTTLKIPLSRGENKIQVSALNQGGAESLKATTYITYDAPERKPDIYLITIGVSDYQVKDKDLKYAAKDAQDIATLYQTNEAFGQTHIKTLTNAQVSKSNILALREWLGQSKVDDQVLIFVSGHGILDENYDFYYGTHDIDFANPSEKGIRYDDIEGLLDGIPARKKLLLIDACHSGEYDADTQALTQTQQDSLKAKGIAYKGFSKSGDETPPVLGLQNSFEMMKQLFADLRRGSGATVISSSSGMQFSYEDSEWQNGAFTYVFLRGLKTMEADANGDEEVTASEIQAYVAKFVPRLTEGLQVPTFRRENLEYDFRMW